jgi:hypothetical protein
MKANRSMLTLSVMAAASLAACGELEANELEHSDSDEQTEQGATEIDSKSQALWAGNCTPAESTQLHSLLGPAKTRVDRALSRSFGFPTYHQLAVKWFGSPGWFAVAPQLQDIQRKLAEGSFQFYCSGIDPSVPTWNPACGTGLPGDRIAGAVVFGDGKQTVLICPKFWSLPATGTDGQTEGLLHELAHFIGADDRVAGQGPGGALALAQSDWTSAIKSAYNYQYFFSEIPQ